MVLKEFKLTATQIRFLGRAWLATHDPFTGVQEDCCTLCTLTLLNEQARQDEVERQ